MPPSLQLRLEAVGDSGVVSYGGGRVLALYERGDQGMRNLAIVSLTRAGVPGVEVAALFGIRPEHVSRLRRHAAEGGARALLPPRGRPSKVDARALARAYEMSDQGVSGSAIAQALGVSEATISRLLARRPGRGGGRERRRRAERTPALSRGRMRCLIRVCRAARSRRRSVSQKRRSRGCWHVGRVVGVCTSRRASQ